MNWSSVTKPAIEALIKQRLQSGEFKDAEDVILQALKSSEATPRQTAADRAAAIQRLKRFGKTHGLALGRITIKDLLHESRP